MLVSVSAPSWPRVGKLQWARIVFENSSNIWTGGSSVDPYAEILGQAKLPNLQQRDTLDFHKLVKVNFGL